MSYDDDGDVNQVTGEPGRPYNIRHRAFYFSKELMLLVSKERYEPPFLPVYRRLVDSGTSIGANLVEGKAGVSKKDFLNFNGIAVKSANETKYWLNLLVENVGNDKSDLQQLLQEATELANIIASIIINSKNNDKDKS